MNTAYVQEEIDNTIVALCKWIQHHIDDETSMYEGVDPVCNRTRALSELVTAKKSGGLVL